jgi:condensin complex subunit 1
MYRLTGVMTLAELTSLEQLVSLMVEKDMINAAIIESLWYIFGKRDTTPAKRRGSLQILSMMGRAQREIIADKVQLLLTVGLGELARDDLVLAKLACGALQQLARVKRGETTGRMPQTHTLFLRLKELLLDLSESQSWFAFAEQAINTMYLLAEHPDDICGAVVKVMTGKVFGISREGDGDISALMAGINNVNIDASGVGDHIGVDECGVKPGVLVGSFEISKLMFVVGHVGVKQIVHLEVIESEWKRRKQAGVSLFLLIFRGIC